MPILHFCLWADDKKISRTVCLELVRVSGQTGCRILIFSLSIAAIISGKRNLNDEIIGYLKCFTVSCIFFPPSSFPPSFPSPSFPSFPSLPSLSSFTLSPNLYLPVVYKSVFFKHIELKYCFVLGPAFL